MSLPIALRGAHARPAAAPGDTRVAHRARPPAAVAAFGWRFQRRPRPHDAGFEDGRRAPRQRAEPPRPRPTPTRARELPSLIAPPNDLLGIVRCHSRGFCGRARPGTGRARRRCSPRAPGTSSTSTRSTSRRRRQQEEAESAVARRGRVGQGGDGTAAAPAETQVRSPEAPTTTAPTTAAPAAEGSETLPGHGPPRRRARLGRSPPPRRRGHAAPPCVTSARSRRHRRPRGRPLGDRRRRAGHARDGAATAAAASGSIQRDAPAARVCTPRRPPVGAGLPPAACPARADSLLPRQSRPGLVATQRGLDPRPRAAAPSRLVLADVHLLPAPPAPAPGPPRPPGDHAVRVLAPGARRRARPRSGARIGRAERSG